MNRQLPENNLYNPPLQDSGPVLHGSNSPNTEATIKQESASENPNQFKQISSQALPSSSKAQSPKSSDDPSLDSFVKDFKARLQSAFDETPQSRPTPKVEVTHHEDNSESDSDEMITGLPLASHFDISRKSGDKGRPSLSHSRNSSRSMDVENQNVMSKVEEESAVRLSPQSTFNPHLLPTSYDVTSPADEVMEKPTSIHPVSNQLKNLHEVESLKAASTDSDLYESSIGGTKIEEDKPEIRHPSNQDGELATVQGQNGNGPENAELGGLASASLEMAAVEPSKELHESGERQTDHRRGSYPMSTDDRTTEAAVPQRSQSVQLEDLSNSSTHSSELTPPTREPPPVPRQQGSNPPVPQVVGSPTSAGQHPSEPTPPRKSPPPIPGQQQSNPPSPFKNLNSANSLRRKELLSSDFVRYSNAEEHGLKIILTPESNNPPAALPAADRAAPPRRKPPPVPQIVLAASSPAKASKHDSLPADSSNTSVYMMSGALGASPVERDGSMADTMSTLSSSDPSDIQTISSPRTSASNTIATTFSASLQDPIRTQAQRELQRLQQEHAAAKSRGDLSAAKASLQKSKEIIQKAYPETNIPETDELLGRSRSNRKPLMSMKSISRLSTFGKGSKVAEMHEAARKGNADLLQKILEEKIHPDARGENHKTAQMEAAQQGHLDCLSALKYHGADEFAVDGQGRTVLHFAVMANQPKAVNWLLQSYAPPPLPPPKRKVSKFSRATEAVAGLRSHKVLRETSDAEGSRPLHVASILALPEMAKVLLNDGATVDARDNWGRTPLMVAIIHNQRPGMLTLLDGGADIAAVDAHSKTPLHWAAKKNRVDMLQILLEKGADRTAFDSNGDLPIHVAAREGHVEAIECLLNEKMQPDVQTKYGETLLHLAVLANHQNVAEYLLKNNVNVNAWSIPHSYKYDASNVNHKSLPSTMPVIPLHYSCIKGYFEMTLLLLDHAAWVNAAPDNGTSPLMMAVECGDTNLVCLLLARGAKVNAAIPGSCITAIHISCRRGDLETTQVLIQHGAKRVVRTSDMRTPAEFVSKVKDSKKRKALENYFEELTRADYNKVKAKLAREQAERQANGGGYQGPGLTPVPSPSPMPLQQTQTQQTTQQTLYQTMYVPQQQVVYAPGAVPSQQNIDMENDTFPEAPPAYFPGPNAPQRLVDRPGVTRGYYG